MHGVLDHPDGRDRSQALTSAPLDARALEAHRSDLLRRRASAASRVLALEGDVRDMRAALDVSDHLDDHATSVLYDIEWSSDLARHVRADLLAIDEALWRLELGEYGLCRTCGVAISSERLEARPQALECTPCASRGR